MSVCRSLEYLQFRLNSVTIITIRWFIYNQNKKAPGRTPVLIQITVHVNDQFENNSIHIIKV
jgi:hypothetical protein